MEGIERMSQITPNGIPNDGNLRLIPTHHPRPQPINLQPQKTSKPKANDAGWSWLCAPVLSPTHNIVSTPDDKLLSPIPAVPTPFAFPRSS